MKLILASLNDLPQIAGEFLALNNGKKQFAFYGNMGVGKTTFIKEICRQLGVKQVVTSPTFALINEYNTTDNQIVYHFDFYRLAHPTELIEIGFEEYMRREDGVCLIEWADLFGDILPPRASRIRFSSPPPYASSRSLLSGERNWWSR